jgi:hypothetical protein
MGELTAEMRGCSPSGACHRLRYRGECKKIELGVKPWDKIAQRKEISMYKC